MDRAERIAREFFRHDTRWHLVNRVALRDLLRQHGVGAEEPPAHMERVASRPCSTAVASVCLLVLCIGAGIGSAALWGVCGICERCDGPRIGVARCRCCHQWLCRTCLRPTCPTCAEEGDSEADRAEAAADAPPVDAGDNEEPAEIEELGRIRL